MGTSQTEPPLVLVVYDPNYLKHYPGCPIFGNWDFVRIAMLIKQWHSVRDLINLIMQDIYHLRLLRCTLPCGFRLRVEQSTGYEKHIIRNTRNFHTLSTGMIMKYLRVYMHN